MHIIIVVPETVGWKYAERVTNRNYNNSYHKENMSNIFSAF